MKACIICGFDKRVHKHHIIKRAEGGSDDEDNLVYLCLNHHWIADFGTAEDREEILILIDKITNKKGKMISGEEQELLESKIKVLGEEGLGEMDGEFWEKFKETSNYSSLKAWLLGRRCPEGYSQVLNEKAEKLILIKKIRKSIPLFQGQNA